MNDIHNTSEMRATRAEDVLDRIANQTVVTNTPRAGETSEQIAIRNRDRDPGVSDLSLASTQVNTVMTNMTDNIINDMTKLRDELDDAMRNYQAHGAAIMDLIGRHKLTGESFRAVREISTDAVRAVQECLREEGVAISKLVNQKKD